MNNDADDDRPPWRPRRAVEADPTWTDVPDPFLSGPDVPAYNPWDRPRKPWLDIPVALLVGLVAIAVSVGLRSLTLSSTVLGVLVGFLAGVRRAGLRDIRRALAEQWAITSPGPVGGVAFHELYMRRRKHKGDHFRGQH
ncbi:MAG: hypothetical protein ACK5RL_03370 [Acidimicrobiales bacterium]